MQQQLRLRQQELILSSMQHSLYVCHQFYVLLIRVSLIPSTLLLLIKILIIFIICARYALVFSNVDPGKIKKMDQLRSLHEIPINSIKINSLLKFLFHSSKLFILLFICMCMRERLIFSQNKFIREENFSRSTLQNFYKKNVSICIQITGFNLF